MPHQSDTASHCVVQWEDNKDQYAIVDTKRSKTVSTLKIGITTLFEGYNRERRRGKILYLGTKKDCLAYGFDIVEDDTQLNTYTWSNPPGLREQSDDIAQAIRNGSLSSFQRTISSSSTNSTALPTKRKGKAMNSKDSHNNDESTTSGDKLIPQPLSPEIINDTTGNADQDQSSNSNNQAPCANNQSSSSPCSTAKRGVLTSKTNTVAASLNIDAVLEENKILREKILTLQDELLYQREHSIALPNEESYDYLKSICIMHEQLKNDCHKQATELGKRLPCKNIELKLAKKANASATINNLIKVCFKNIELKNMSYEKLKAEDSQLLENIHEYVKFIHAPAIISQSMFSGAISLKCRHLRGEEKHKKDDLTIRKENRKQQEKQKKFSNDVKDGHQNDNDLSNDILIDDMDEN
ncbi:unnamed protein product [Rotaria magnacalcarata]|uniref:Uncharacterized protein n=11 Tax=Rotaria TaxID=231623 RepID=A0A816R8K9_9BILA|nr:unnamed protein product [Rotaria magnacalcarata]CAF4010156.1 unnamed protein product [Rotaria magnacalcarata]